jgi:HNH endonuclease
MEFRDDIQTYIDNRIVKSPCIYPELEPCWLWTGGQYGDGYASSKLYGGIRPYKKSQKKYRVHRIVYQMFCGELKPDEILLHQCDTASCCNPNHLKIGTHRENSLDYYRRQKPHQEKLSTENSDTIV